MRPCQPFLAYLAALACSGPAAAQSFHPKRTYPAFLVGVSGIEATVEPGLRVTVRSARAGSPAAGKLRAGDVILTAGRHPVVGPDPRRPLGLALGDAEAGDGRLALRIRRGAAEQAVTLTIPHLGGYAESWPRDCAKSAGIVRATAAFVASRQRDDGSYQLGGRPERDGLQGCLLGLFLLSTGDDRYLPQVRRQAHALAAAAAERPTGSTWHLGYQGILLAEYFLRTGDRQVLGGLRALCDKAVAMQAADAWGHGAGVQPGYVQSGQMNSAGVPVLTTFVLARECGVRFDERAYAAALKFFYRMAGHGSVCYGDHRSELFPNTNGRNAMLACALGLLDEPRFQRAAQHLALLVADSYYAPEFGHTGGGFNVIWRGLGTALVPARHQDRYRRQMDQLRWYYDLCRAPGGGFSLPATPPDNGRYAGMLWGTGAIGLTYTAPLRTLRITGAPRSRHSVANGPQPWSWGTAADQAFLAVDHAAGFGAETVAPAEVHELLRGRDTSRAGTAFCAQQLRHQNPMIRTWAARVLANRAATEPAALDALVDASRHADPRVRRAAFDGVSGYDNWGRATAANRYLTRMPPALVSEHFLDRILTTLRDPQAAWWEIDGALWALGRAAPADIRKHLAIVRRFAGHPEWYLREAAFWAMVGLHDTITAAEFQTLADIYGAERHVFARSSFDAGFRHLVHGDKVRLPAAAEAQAIRTLGRTLHSAPLIASYGRAAAHEAAHRTMMILKHFDPRVYRYLVDDFVTYLATWSPNYQHSVWLITGSRWQPGLIKVIDSLGPQAAPIIAAFEKCLVREAGGRQQTKAHQSCDTAMRAAIRRFRAKDGR